MMDFVYSYPTKVYFGKNVSKKALDEQLNKYGKNVMLAYGKASIKYNGIYDEIVSILKEHHKNIIEFNGIMPNPTYEKVLEGVKIARENNVDLILAVGGGSVIDCCKVVAAQSKLDEDIWEMEFTKGIFPSDGIALGAIVTLSGTGAEMNAGAVITNEEKHIKCGVMGVAPSFTILDPYYTLSVNKELTIAGAYDTFSHALETYLGNSNKDNVSDELCLAIMKNTVINMRRLLVDINDIEARSNLMWDSAMAENGILKIGKKTDFQVHQIEHQLAAYTDCNHGRGLALIQPRYLRHIKDDANDKLLRFANTVFERNTVEDGLCAFECFIKECELPVTYDQLKSKVDITDEILKKVAYSSNIIKTNPRMLDKDEILDILNECKGE